MGLAETRWRRVRHLQRDIECDGGHEDQNAGVRISGDEAEESVATTEGG